MTGTTLVVADVQQLARSTGLHPDMVRRLLQMGAAEATAIDAAARLARVMRLRRDLGVNYAGAILACDLLARIDQLEARLSWTRTN